jgi:glycosyltransferase involved in cell wall biosynthesis
MSVSSSPVLTVVIAAHQEKPADIAATVKSIHNTGGGSFVEVIIVDDASTIPVEVGGAKIIRNMHRMGVGPSRHVGVEAASAPLIVITDAHVLFHDGWLTQLLDVLNGGGEKLLVCGQMDAIPETGDKNLGRYYGGHMIFHDPSTDDPRWKILTAKWSKEKAAPYYPISAVMGACYAMRRDFFLKIGGLKMLRNFGGDEEMLSMKTLLAGGEIRLFKPWKISHRFRNGKPPYRITVDDCVYNSMLLAHLCCPPDVAKDLISKIGPGVEVINAKEMIRQNMAPIQVERERLLYKVFARYWDDYVRLVNEIG